MAGTGCTLRIDISQLPVKMATAEIISYVTDRLELPKEQLVRVHFRPITKTIYIDVKDHAQVLKVLSEQEANGLMPICGKMYQIPLTMDDGSILIKLHDVPPHVSNREIQLVLGRYGTVIHVGEGRWPSKSPFAGLLDGYRYAQIILTTAVPEYLEIAGITTLASYHGLLNIHEETPAYGSAPGASGCDPTTMVVSFGDVIPAAALADAAVQTISPSVTMPSPAAVAATPAKDVPTPSATSIARLRDRLTVGRKAVTPPAQTSKRGAESDDSKPAKQRRSDEMP